MFHFPDRSIDTPYRRLRARIPHILVVAVWAALLFPAAAAETMRLGDR